MKKLIYCYLFIFFLNNGQAQIHSCHSLQYINNEEVTIPLLLKSRPPKFPGDQSAFQNFVSSTFHFPERAFHDKIEGTIYVEVDINQKGVLHVLGVNGALGGGCEQEALRVIEAMPCWLPALQNSEPVNCKMLLPITFALK
jgi:hypothetical protein